MRRLLDKRLHNAGHTLYCLVPQHRRHGRNLSPSKEFQPFLLCNDLKHFLCLIALQLILREKEIANAILTLSANFDSQLFCDLFHKLVRYLRQNTDTITCLALSILTGSVLQIFHDPKRVFHDRAALLSLNIHAGSDTAVIMFELCTVQWCFRHCHSRVKHMKPPISLNL